MIICGYAGIGKSYLAHNFPNIIDLESTPFEKDWDRYFKCAKHYSDQGFLVLLSCHKEIRVRVLKMPYDERITIFPCIEDKELFRKRYKQRGNSEEFIKLQMDNWDEWTSDKNWLLGEHLEYMKSGETLYETILRLSKLSPNRFCTYDSCPVSDCTMKELPKPIRRLCKEIKTMTQYIDKSALVAEIDSLQDATMDENRNFLSSYHEGIFDGLSEVETFIDSLEVKEIDLGKEIKRFTMSKELFESDSVIKAVAEHFFELGINTRKI